MRGRGRGGDTSHLALLLSSGVESARTVFPMFYVKDLQPGQEGMSVVFTKLCGGERFHDW